ncbi:pyridoxal 5'-phosphate synthase glutaminase subunit PdxT [Bacillota bacterium LX-D]|nr:pyridoxal 5'-phosphate synthase glutaminase subunit PdxT [Bacillota bacterium LX-D]
MVRIGVLALQGSVAEHMKMLSRIEGLTPCEIRRPEEIETTSGIILPGGESTTIGKLLKEFNLSNIIIEKARNGTPVWGTCAGMILLAKEIVGENYVHLGLMDISVRRNAYGSQLDSFFTKCKIPDVSDIEIPLVFIRAPWVEWLSKNVKVLAHINGKAIAVRQDNILATSFHPELTDDLSFHRYFAKMVLSRMEKDSRS